MIGLDTGFFVELLRKNSTATTLWKKIVKGDEEAVVSCLSLFELQNFF